MRLALRPTRARFAVPATLVAVLAVPAGAQAGPPKNVDPALAAVVASAEKRQPRTAVQVIVYGKSTSRALRGTRARNRRSLPFLGAQSARVEARRVRKLAAQRGVAYVGLDYPVLPTARARPQPITFPALASLFPAVDAAPEAWSLGYGGRGVGIAVIDSGVAESADFGTRVRHVQLGGTVAGDEYGHGSFVAGIAAGESPDGRYVGIAPRSRIFSVDVARPDGVYTSDILAGVAWVLRHHRKLKIRVVVLSVSETTPSSYRSNPLNTAVEELWRRGIVVVVSAGNLGAGSMAFAPANDPRVITVGALDPNATVDPTDDFEAAFSSRGLTLDGIRKPEILAPGRRIVSVLPPDSTLGREAPPGNWLSPGHASMSGTSFSAPQVAGAAALLLERNPTWRPDQVKWTLMQTLREVPGASAGALDIGAAMEYEGTPGDANKGLQPAKFGLRGATRPMFVRMRPRPPARPQVDWNANAWNANAWNANAWNANAWNRASWVASAWTANAWHANAWTGNAWNAAAFD
jgi:serine protease AprX